MEYYFTIEIFPTTLEGMLRWVILLASLGIIVYKFSDKIIRSSKALDVWRANPQPPSAATSLVNVARLLEGATRSRYRFEQARRYMTDLLLERVAAVRGVPAVKLKLAKLDREEMAHIVRDKELLEFVLRPDAFESYTRRSRDASQKLSRDEISTCRLAYLQLIGRLIERWKS